MVAIYTCPVCGTRGRQQRLGELWDRPQSICQCLACDRFYLSGGAVVVEMPTITDHEKQHLSLIAAGKPNKEIARVLGISLRNVHIRRHVLMEKIGATNTADLVRKVTELGLLKKRPTH